eukprot:6460029-Amphidinium_carterae.2
MSAEYRVYVVNGDIRAICQYLGAKDTSHFGLQCQRHYYLTDALNIIPELVAAVTIATKNAQMDDKSAIVTIVTLGRCLLVGRHA